MREWGGEVVFYEGSSHSAGQMILFRKGFCGTITLVHESERILIVVVEIIYKRIVIANAYAPNIISEKNTFFQEITNIVKSMHFDDILLCGDFNCVLNNDRDIISGEHHAKNTVTNFNDVLNECNLFDTWRLFNPDIKEYTWSKRNPLVARRLDYILTSSTLFDETRECNIMSVPMSDHRGCSITIQFVEVVKGPDYWKLNNSLLEDINYVNQTNDLIDSFLTENSNNTQDQQSWELLKLRIKDFSITYSKQKNLEKKPLY
jgi:hypothetical protein